MIKGFLIDVEGTIVLDKSYSPVPGAPSWLNRLSDTGKPFLLATNNTTHTPENLRRLLGEKGFRVRGEQIHGCLSLALDYLISKRFKTCFILANQKIKDFLKENKIEVREDWKVDAVLVGLDTQLNYIKLKVATCALVQNKAKLLALHKNRIYKDDKGELAPSVGAVVRFLEYVANKKAMVFGKPNRIFYLKALEKLGSKPNETVMISDDPLTDLVGAKRVGIKTAFVTSGKYGKTILKRLPKELWPDRICNNITQIKT